MNGIWEDFDEQWQINLMSGRKLNRYNVGWEVKETVYFTV